MEGRSTSQSQLQSQSNSIFRVECPGEGVEWCQLCCDCAMIMNRLNRHSKLWLRLGLSFVGKSSPLRLPLNSHSIFLVSGRQSTTVIERLVGSVGRSEGDRKRPFSTSTLEKHRQGSNENRQEKYRKVIDKVCKFYEMKDRKSVV